MVAAMEQKCGQEELPHVQGKEQWLRFTGAAVKKCPTSKDARIYGFTDKGALTPGYRADIAVYDINPNEIDPSRQADEIEKGFNVAEYTIKDGQILVKDKEIVQVKESQNVWVNVKGWEKQEQKVIDNIMPFFTQYYSVKWENYPVHDHYVSNPIRIDVDGK